MEYDIIIDTGIGCGGITAQYVRARLANMKNRPVTVFINSLGGDVRHALDIREQFVNHGNVTAYIFGMSASAATILAMGAKKIVMSKFSTMLIHQCSSWVDSWGSLNADQIREEIKKLSSASDNLAKIDGIIASCYAARSGRTVADFKEVMTKANWLTAEECLALGVIDSITEEGEEHIVTDDERLRIVASGYPDPVRDAAPETPAEPAQAPEAPAAEEPADDTPAETAPAEDHVETIFNSFFAAVRRFLNMEARHNNTTPEQTPKTTPMNKKYKTVEAVLQVEALSASEDGTYHLTAEQMDAIQAKMDDDAGQLEQLRTENSAKDEQIENLGKEDSSESPAVVGSETKEETAADMYARAKRLYH